MLPVHTSVTPVNAHSDGTSALVRGHRLRVAVLLGRMLWLHWEARSWELPCLSSEPPESVHTGVRGPHPLGPALLRYAVCVSALVCRGPIRKLQFIAPTPQHCPP